MAKKKVKKSVPALEELVEQPKTRPATIAESVAMEARRATIDLAMKVLELENRINRIVQAIEKSKSVKGL